MIELVQHHALRVRFRQQRLAEGMKRRQRHRFASFAGGLHHPGFHFAGGFLREGQAENIFAGEAFIGFQEVPDAFCNDTRFSRSGARNHQQWPFAERDGAALRVVQLQLALPERLHVKQRRHDSRRVAECRAKGKRRVEAHLIRGFPSMLALRLFAGGNLPVEFARLLFRDR